jgi:hypothetical protein
VYAALENYMTAHNLMCMNVVGTMTIAGVGNKHVNTIKKTSATQIQIIGSLTFGYTDTWTIAASDGKGSSIEVLVI